MRIILSFYSTRYTSHLFPIPIMKIKELDINYKEEVLGLVSEYNPVCQYWT